MGRKEDRSNTKEVLLTAKMELWNRIDRRYFENVYKCWGPLITVPINMLLYDKDQHARLVIAPLENVGLSTKI